MSFLIDTDFCVSYLRIRPSSLAKMDEVGWEAVGISQITLAELYVGAVKSARTEWNLLRIEEVARNLTVFPLTDDILRVFAVKKVELMQAGQRLEDFDLLIAATAIVEGRTLITNNVRHFGRISGLRVESWVTP